MATIFLTQASSGAPTLSGTNGALCAVLDWALVQNGWAVEYTAANNRIYRAGTGRRFRLFVSHDSTVSGDARLATIRGCENAAAASSASLTDPFPQVGQVANALSSVLCSTTANATARDYIIAVTPTAVVMVINCASSTTSNWDIFAFGDAVSADSTDAWNTFIWIGATNSAAGSSGRAMNAVLSTNATSSGRVFWCRSIEGGVKSTHGCFFAACSGGAATSMCAVTAAPIMRGGYGNRIVREKVGITCLGSSTTTSGVLQQIKRGWLPNVYAPTHSGIGAITTADTFEDLTSGADFVIVPAANAQACILEVSDTWAPPNG